VGKSIEVVGDSVEVDGVPRGVVWAGAEHADVSGVVASVEEGHMGAIVLQGGGGLQNPKPGPTPAAALTAADVGKSIEVVGDSVEVDGVPRGVVWAGAEHADVSGVVASVEEGHMGAVVLEGGEHFSNPKPGPVVYRLPPVVPVVVPAPLKAWSKTKGVPALILVKEPTPLTLQVFHVKAFDVADADKSYGSGIADPYVRFSHPSSGVSSRTEARRNQANPEFEHRVQMTMPEGFEHPPRILVTLWDKDWLSEDTMLAQQEVCLDGVIQEGEEIDDGTNAKLNLKGQGEYPDVKVHFSYAYSFTVPAAAIVEIFDLKAFGVPDADVRKGTQEKPDVSDPYMRFVLLESDKLIAAETSERMNATNPEWTETISIACPRGSPRPPLFQVCLWDKDWGNPDDSLASDDVRLPLDESTEEWAQCATEGEVTMTLVGHKPYKDVKVVFKYRVKLDD